MFNLYLIFLLKIVYENEIVFENEIFLWKRNCLWKKKKKIISNLFKNVYENEKLIKNICLWKQNLNYKKISLWKRKILYNNLKKKISDN